MKPQRWYSTTQVGQRIGRSRSQVLRLVEVGMFPNANRPPGGFWRVPESDVTTYLERHRPKVRRRAS